MEGRWRGGEGRRAKSERREAAAAEEEERSRRTEEERRPFLSVSLSLSLSARCGAQERKGEVEQRGLQVIPERQSLIWFIVGFPSSPLLSSSSSSSASLLFC